MGIILGFTMFAQSYYPIELGTSWTYNVTDYATSDTSRKHNESMLSGEHNREEWGIQKMKIVVEKDSIINDKTYRVLANTNGSKVELVREENGNYFRFNNNTFKDDNFLKPGLEVGNLWIDYSNAEQTIATIYKVISMDKQKTIKGRNYKNVIAISEYTGSTEQFFAIFRSNQAFPIVSYYAEGVGLIYNYTPYPLGNTYSDLEVSLDKD
jgi:hypothetical protein